MLKIAIVILADTESSEGLGRAVNALTAAKEYKLAGDTVSVTFTGAGTKWVALLNDETHTAHALYQEVKDIVSGACMFCANAFNQQAAVEASGTEMLCEFGESMSYKKLSDEGYQIITF